MNWICVTPSNRLDRLAEFYESWESLFSQHNVEWLVVLDTEGSGWKHPDIPATVVSWSDIPEWSQMHCDSIRSYGFYQAWKRQPKYIVTLDDDVRPSRDIFTEYERVFELGVPVSDYLDVGALTDSAVQMRGFPHEQRERKVVAVQYGGWSGVLDYDAATQIAGVPDEALFAEIVLPAPVGCAVTGCSMNMAWRTEFTPLVWQLPILGKRYFRYGDIWGGLLTKKACDSAGLAVVVNGKAQVRHERASDPAVNLIREAAGLPHNEILWGALDGEIPWTHPEDAWRTASNRMISYFTTADPEYAEWFKSCRDKWLELFV